MAVVRRGDVEAAIMPSSTNAIESVSADSLSVRW
jgi:hypothetical protein